jgi:hypothetical protein
LQSVRKTIAIAEYVFKGAYFDVHSPLDHGDKGRCRRKLNSFSKLRLTVAETVGAAATSGWLTLPFLDRYVA